MNFFKRFGQCILPMLIAIDLMACTIWLSVLYPLGLANRPTGRELISGYVGEASANGMRWGICAAAVIDWCACKLGDEPGHCARTYALWRKLET